MIGPIIRDDDDAEWFDRNFIENPHKKKTQNEDVSLLKSEIRSLKLLLKSLEKTMEQIKKK